MLNPGTSAKNHRLLTLEIRYEHDVVFARQRARQIAELIGFDLQDQSRLGTAVSEIVRNAFRYAGGGKIEYVLLAGTPWRLQVQVSDRGPGIPHLDDILSGLYRSSTGMGMGILGTRRLMEDFTIESVPGEGTTVRFSKAVPPRAPDITPAVIARIGKELARSTPENPYEEMQRQNQEMLRTLDQLQARQEELDTLNRELEDTNRGVVALYAELEERASYLRRVSDLKSRFLSNMSHEFRTPLNSILSLTRMLLDGTDGELAPEQVRQVTFIRRSAEELSELVNDLLDLAKVEAGKLTVRPEAFRVSELFGALRGVLKPLTDQQPGTELVFENPEDFPSLYTDEGKVSQVLRNFISNALKFTPKGEVRVTARQMDQGMIRFAVSDTGIGIATEDQERIFEEFAQVENALQRKVKGTGLGLPLCKKLAELLGGQILVESRPGFGSTFSLEIPLSYGHGSPYRYSGEPSAQEPRAQTLPVLIVEDRAEFVLGYQKDLEGTEFHPVAVRNVAEARRALREVHPAAVILDILVEGDTTWHFLQELKSAEPSARLPVIVATVVDAPDRAFALGADRYTSKPVHREWLLEQLRALTRPAAPLRLLIIDDDEVARYVLRSRLARLGAAIQEAPGGRAGLQLAREMQPDLIFLDLAMPDLHGLEVLEQLRSEDLTRSIPVIIFTSMSVSSEHQQFIAESGARLLKKDNDDPGAPVRLVDELVRGFKSGGEEERA